MSPVEPEAEAQAVAGGGKSGGGEDEAAGVREALGGRRVVRSTGRRIGRIAPAPFGLRSPIAAKA